MFHAGRLGSAYAPAPLRYDDE